MPPTVGTFLNSFAHPWAMQLSSSRQLNNNQPKLCPGLKFPVIWGNRHLLQPSWHRAVTRVFLVQSGTLGDPGVASKWPSL